MIALARVYRWLLRMYPRDYADQFGAEMTSVFEEAAAEQWRKGLLPFVRFVFWELAGLAAGAQDAHKAPLLERELAVDFSVPPELADAQRAVEYSKQQMQKAIATHDFKKARFFCLVDERARLKVQWLRAKHRLPDA
jgi:hypothetical protein